MGVHHAEFRDVENYLETLDRLYERRKPTLLIGEAGVGKTSLVELCCARNSATLITKMGGNFPTSKLVGYETLRATPSGGTQTEFLPGPLTRAVLNGSVFYLDELDSVSDEIYDLIHPLLDHRRYLSRAELGHSYASDNGSADVFPAHPDFWFVASCVSSNYAKSKIPDDFLDRFRVLEIKALDFKEQVQLLQHRTQINDQDASLLCLVANMSKTVWKKPISIRQLLAAAEDIQSGHSFQVSIEINFFGPNIRNQAEREALVDALKAHGIDLFQVTLSGYQHDPVLQETLVDAPRQPAAVNIASATKHMRKAVKKAR